MPAASRKCAISDAHPCFSRNETQIHRGHYVAAGRRRRTPPKGGVEASLGTVIAFRLESGIDHDREVRPGALTRSIGSAALSRCLCRRARLDQSRRTRRPPKKPMLKPMRAGSTSHSHSAMPDASASPAPRSIAPLPSTIANAEPERAPGSTSTTKCGRSRSYSANRRCHQPHLYRSPDCVLPARPGAVTTAIPFAFLLPAAERRRWRDNELDS